MAKRLTPGIDVDRLDQLIQDMGVRIKLYKSTLIPNMTSLESMDQDLNEDVSQNNMIDFDCIETVALFQQQDLSKTFQIQGTFHIDEILVSFLSGVVLAPFARIEVLDFTEAFYELVQRQKSTDVDVLKYSACSVDGIFTYTKAGKVIDRYHPGVDFIINPNGDIKWIGAHRPADSQIYSVYYNFHPTYRAVKAVHRDRFSQYNARVHTIKAPKTTVDGKTYVKMPETWVLKRDYLIEKSKNELYDPNE